MGDVIGLSEAKRQVLLTFLQANPQEEMLIRVFLRLKIIKQGDNNQLLRERAPRKIW